MYKNVYNSKCNFSTLKGSEGKTNVNLGFIWALRPWFSVEHVHPYALQCMPYNINIRNSNRKLFTGKIKPGQIKPLKTKTTLKTFLTFSVSVAHVECTQKVRFLVSKYLDINSQGACFKICKARILHWVRINDSIWGLQSHL